MFSHQTSFPFLATFGLSVGLMAGLFWGNRNFIELHLVPDKNRNYFYSVLGFIFSLINVIVPVAIGWFIVAGVRSGLYTSGRAYEILAVIGILVMLCAGRLIFKHATQVPYFTTIFARFKSKLWRKVQAMSFIIGFAHGITAFVPPLMILYLVGNEGALGGIASLAAVAGGVGVYILGRISKPNNRAAIGGFGIWILIGVSLLFSYFYSPLTVIIYNIGLAFYSLFFGAGHDPILYAAIEADNRGENPLHYARLCDREIFLNSGRLCGIGLFLALFFYTSPDISLRLTPLITALTQLPLLLLLPRIMRESTTRPVTS
jgi:YQGE family putative transporter